MRHSVRGLLKKLALHAYRIVDEDVEALRNEGYVDEAIFEITAVGAVSAATVGAEQLFEAMYAAESSQSGSFATTEL